MFEVILAATKTGGIGLNGRMAWKCTEELKLFQEKTNNSVLIIGRKTAQTLPKLENRIVVCISKNKKLKTYTYKNRVHVFNNFEEALEYSYKLNKKIFVAGGSQLYNLVFKEFKNRIDAVHISIMNKEYLTDANFDFDKKGFLIKEKYIAQEFTHYVYVPGETDEQQYLNLLENVKKFGVLRDTRNGETLAKFVSHLNFDLRNGFPLLTTKKMFWKGIVEELLFFLRGDTDTSKLEEKDVKIWSDNTNREFLDNNGFTNRKKGVMGPMYGYQLRNFGAEYDENFSRPFWPGLDQLSELIIQLKEQPHSRRHLMTVYNPLQAKQGVLYPCHSIILQFFVDREYIDVFCYNRSSDLFLGLPFNIASTALLVTIIASISELTPRYFNLTLGDSHIYKEHLEAVTEQISRTCYKFPQVSIKKDLFTIEDIENLSFEDFELKNYNCHEKIKAKMIA